MPCSIGFMATSFLTSDLLRGVANYPIAKDRHSPEEQVASLLAQKAGSLRIRLNGNLHGAEVAHRSIAGSHRELAHKLSGIAAEKHTAAAQEHDAAADEIAAIMPVTGGSVAAHGLTGDKARAYAGVASRASAAALQATIDGADASIQKVADQDLFGESAKQLAAKHDAEKIDYRAMGGAHIGTGIRHLDTSKILANIAQQERNQNGGADNAKSRAYDMAATAHKDAMQAHYTAGRTNDDLAYSGSKVEGGSPNMRPSGGNAKWSSKVAATASEKADEMTKKAEEVGNSMDA